MTAVPAHRLAVVLLLLGPGDPCVGRQICLMLGLVDSWDLGGRGLWSEHRNVMCVKCCGWCVGDMTLLHCCFGRSTEWTECCMGTCGWGTGAETYLPTGTSSCGRTFAQPEGTPLAVCQPLHVLLVCLMLHCSSCCCWSQCG
jgi:hypothetical protein